MNERYEFSFERGQFMKVVAGLLSLVILVFSAGILTGIALQMREPAPTLVAQAPQPKPAAPPAPQLVTPPPAPPVAEEDLPAVEPSADQAVIDPDDQPAVEEEPAKTASNPVAPERPQADTRTGFSVQFGAFLQASNAAVLAKRISGKGYNAEVVVREDSHGRTWYLVRYGLFTNRAEASAAADELKNRENLDALVRPLNSM